MIKYPWYPMTYFFITLTMVSMIMKPENMLSLLFIAIFHIAIANIIDTLRDIK